ncbi:MAG: corrinoid protein [Deltaproteobacteria bacterium]|nr:corrinoid protein [Deltaproteobacteria bacterium]
MPHLYRKISEALIRGNIAEIKRLTQQALDEGIQAYEILENGLFTGMDIVGQRFKACEIYIPEVLLSAKTMQAAMDIVRPLLSESDAIGVGTVVIGTVEGDLHNIGKDLVAMMLEGTGFRVIDLGVDVKARDFVEAAKAHKPHILGMSALLTTTMPKMRETISALEEAGIRDQIKVMAGGAPINQGYADEIGADAYGADAGEAAEKAKALLKH